MKLYMAVTVMMVLTSLISLSWAQDQRIPFSQRPGIKAQEIMQNDRLAEKPKGLTAWLDASVYAKPVITEDDERTILRKKWSKMVGFDVFYPYFKAKQVETWVKEKTSVRMFKFKGRPEIKSNRFRYVFKMNF